MPFRDRHGYTNDLARGPRGGNLLEEALSPVARAHRNGDLLAKSDVWKPHYTVDGVPRDDEGELTLRTQFPELQLQFVGRGQMSDRRG